jgi:hypothetical protein
MKKLYIILLAGAAASGPLLTGCSKSHTGAAPPGARAEATATAPNDGPADLRIKWKEGVTFPMRMELDQGTEMKAPGQAAPTKQKVKMTQDFNLTGIKKLDNGGWEFGLEFKNEAMDVSDGQHSVMNFDSTQSPAQDGDNPAAPILRAMIGPRIEYFTDAAGKVEKMGGVDELSSRIAAATKPQQRAMFKQVYDEDTLKRYGSFSDALPNRMANLGESWPVKNDIGSVIGTLTMDMKYTFKNWEQHGDRLCAHVVGTGTISSKTVSAAMVGAAVEIQKGKLSDEFWFDPKAGMIAEVHDVQDMTLKITTRTETMTQELTQNVRLSLMDAL